jgi:hypothetical protein
MFHVCYQNAQDSTSAKFCFNRNKTLYSSAAQITIIDEMQARGIIFPERKDSNYQKALLKPDQV